MIEQLQYANRYSAQEDQLKEIEQSKRAGMFVSAWEVWILGTFSIFGPAFSLIISPPYHSHPHIHCYIESCWCLGQKSKKFRLLSQSSVAFTVPSKSCLILAPSCCPNHTGSSNSKIVDRFFEFFVRNWLFFHQSRLNWSCSVAEINRVYGFWNFLVLNILVARIEEFSERCTFFSNREQLLNAPSPSYADMSAQCCTDLARQVIRRNYDAQSVIAPFPL